MIDAELKWHFVAMFSVCDEVVVLLVVVFFVDDAGLFLVPVVPFVDANLTLVVLVALFYAV